MKTTTTRIYDVKIEPSKEENLFRITWQDVEKRSLDSFINELSSQEKEKLKLWEKPAHQLNIGESLFKFLVREAKHFSLVLDRALEDGQALQINLRTCKETADWPFELLAKDGEFLLLKHLHLVRRVSDRGIGRKVSPRDRPLKLLFMACSPMRVKPELDYEREEEFILRSTRDLPIEMEVEDSGSLDGLQRRLVHKQFDVVHLAGHANIDRSNGRPFFQMENDTGEKCKVYPDQLWDNALIENPPSLLFLSGCSTGEVAGAENTDLTPSFTHLLVEKYYVPVVLGWGRKVSDGQANYAEKVIFQGLSSGRSILEAVRQARYELQKKFTTTSEPAWPLLRLFCNGTPLNAFVKAGQRQKPNLTHMSYDYLGNSRIKVLKEGFVGRRRQLQFSLRALKEDYDTVGVLLLGAGGLGKSCLMGKICERLKEHTVIAIRGKFNARSLETALEETFNNTGDKKGVDILAQKKEMDYTLADLCAVSFKEKNYLLLLDGFDRNLEGAAKGRPGLLKQEANQLLQTLLYYLPFSGKMTQLVITSRYTFTLYHQDRDLVKERLKMVWLTSFRETEQRKKVRQLKNILGHDESQLLNAGCGNPLLLERLDHLLGYIPIEEKARLLEEIKKNREDFLRQLGIRELYQQGGEPLRLFLNRLSIYRIPATKKSIQRVAEKTGSTSWYELLQEGLRLSLVEHDQAQGTYQVTSLLKEELGRKFKQGKSAHGEAYNYYAAENKKRGIIDPVITEELIFHAMRCGKEESAYQHKIELEEYFKDRLDTEEAHRLAEWFEKERERDF